MKAALSIILVTYNPGALVLDALHSLPDGTGELPIEVIIVDNASQDGTPERVAQEFPEGRLITNADNRGFAAANNQGLAAASGNYILLLNPDVIVHPGALAEMVIYLDKNPDVGLVGPRVFDSEKRVTLTAHVPFSVATILWQYLGLDRLFPNWVYGHYRRGCQYAEGPFEVGWVSGCCLMMRREVYEQIGGLDDGLFLFAEEPDFCGRAAEAGWRTLFLPGASVTHYESSVVSRYTATRVRHYHLSPLYYFRKRGRESAVLALKIGFTLELLVKTVIRLFQMAWRRDEELASRVQTYWDVLGEVWCY